MDQIRKALQAQLNKMTESSKNLFRVAVDSDKLWELYLASFPEGTNEILKERRQYDCQHCKQFVRNNGNIVSIESDNKIVSIWDIPGLDTPFKEVCSALSAYIASCSIKDVFVMENHKLGVSENLDVARAKIWTHLYCELPKDYPIEIASGGISLEQVQAPFRDNKNVLKRALEEISLDAITTVLELIEDNNLYRGKEYEALVKEFEQYKKNYIKLPQKQKDAWCWKHCFNNAVCRIRNTAIGTLLVGLAEQSGGKLEEEIKKFESKVAPTNYKRPKAVITKAMIVAAEAKIKELGFENSLGRRYAVLEDISVNNVLYVDRNIKPKLKGNPQSAESLFGALKEALPENTAKFQLDKAPKIPIQEFVNTVIPHASKIEVMFDSKQQGNLCSLIAPTNNAAPSILKWGNNFSWAYNGGVADSMKTRVKNFGGKIDGVLRFSIQWNTSGHDNNDLDAHCLEPNNHIYFGIRHNYETTGTLDVDITNPGDKIAVENITWTDLSKMGLGLYKFYVHNYRHRGGTKGFSAEIEFNGELYEFAYPQEVRQGQIVPVANVTLSSKGTFSIEPLLKTEIASKNIWGINSNRFIPVNVIMRSPNYWDEQKGIGNEHFFFMLDGCKNPTPPRGVFNEFLNSALDPHKKVFEALGAKMVVEDSSDQMSGLGFSSTMRAEVVARVDGKIIKIVF